MPLPESCSAAHLAQVLKNRGEEIIEEWRVHARRLLADLHLDKATITDHLPDVVEAILDDLAHSGDDTPDASTGRGSPPVHGVQRFHDGLDVGEVVAEYNLLRVAFNTVAERRGLFIAGDAARIINHRIDEAVRLAVVAFDKQQALIRKELDDEHLAFIAHDLRTPLNAVSLLVEELRESMGEHTLAASGDLFESLTRNLARVGTLIEKVLETKAKPTGSGTSFHPERRPFELWPLVQRLILDLRPVSSAKSIEVVNSIPRTLSVFADAGLVSQVFQNLLDNAFKYTEGGQITVSAEAEGRVVTCVVRDNGNGIPAEMLPRIFDKLATDPNKDGVGLGLTIVKQIVTAHGGTVTAESEPGNGATFSFTLESGETPHPT